MIPVVISIMVMIPIMVMVAVMVSVLVPSLPPSPSPSKVRGPAKNVTSGEAWEIEASPDVGISQLNLLPAERYLRPLPPERLNSLARQRTEMPCQSK